MYCNRVTLTPTYRKEVALSSSTLRSLEESRLMVKITNLHLPSSQKHADKLSGKQSKKHYEAVDKEGKVYVNVQYFLFLSTTGQSNRKMYFKIMSLIVAIRSTLLLVSSFKMYYFKIE